VSRPSLPIVFSQLPVDKAERLFQQTLQQLIKDLDMESSCLDDLERNQTQDLEQRIVIHLHQKTGKSKSALQALLYRADIPEKEYRKVLADKEGKDPLELLAPMFLFRAFTKCYTRMLASEGRL
jgi:hypothetical protein